MRGEDEGGVGRGGFRGEAVVAGVGGRMVGGRMRVMEKKKPCCGEKNPSRGELVVWGVRRVGGSKGVGELGSCNRE